MRHIPYVENRVPNLRMHLEILPIISQVSAEPLLVSLWSKADPIR